MNGELLGDLLADQDFRDPQSIYDGVRGELPDWIPQNFHREFHAIRSRLQDYSHDDLLIFVAEVRNMWESPEPVFGIAVPSQIQGEIFGLAFFQKVVSRGPEEGMALLTDPNHASQTVQGKKFLDGRKKGAIGTIRKFIRTAMKKSPNLTNEELWEALKKRPPKGWSPMENSTFGRYVEGPTPADNLKWRSFCNKAAKERGTISSISEGVKAV